MCSAARLSTPAPHEHLPHLSASANQLRLREKMTSNSNNGDLLDRIHRMEVDRRHERRSPHKPLLLLLSIGRHFNGGERLATFTAIEGDMNRLIRRFGLPVSQQNPHYPFWRLQNDDRLWEIDRPELVNVTKSEDPFISDLRDHDIRGGLPREILDSLDSSPELAWSVVQKLLNDYFPPSLREDVLRDVGLEDSVVQSESVFTKSRPRKGSVNFRNAVLLAYESRCAVCEFDVQVDKEPIGVEAAHIRWHSACGPACVSNGIALCLLHHKFFDSGLFTLSSDLTVLVGGLAEGDDVEDSLNQYGGSPLQVIPDSQDDVRNVGI